MAKTCEICGRFGKYKCPKCYIFYCSVPCSKKHKESNNCNDKNSNSNQTSLKRKRSDKELEYSSGIPKEKLELLDNDKELNKLLANKHLRNLLEVIDKTENAEKIMEEAMQEPIFVEFADACLRLIDPPSDNEDS